MGAMLGNWPIEDFDPHWPEFVADPYPFFARLMKEDPVHKVSSTQVWWITRHADATRVLGWREFSNQAPPNAEDPYPDVELANLAGLEPHMAIQDPPNHTRLRSLVSRAFSPAAVEGLRPRVARIANELLDQVQSEGSMELISDYAYPLPLAVLAEFLGIPPEDRSRFQSLSEQMITTVDDTHPKQTVHDAGKTLRELVEYLEALIAERRSNKRDDLLSSMIAVEEEGDRMSTAELLSMAALLINAGHDTMTGLIGTGTLALLQNRGQLELLRARKELMGTAVEELLRLDPPFQRLHRYARLDLEIGGKSIRTGEPVEAIIAAANRDPTVFNDPEQLDIRRATNPHLSFGRGIHLCLGAPLVRVEAPVAFQTLIERFPNLRFDGQPEWNANTRMRQLRSLPLAL